MGFAWEAEQKDEPPEEPKAKKAEASDIGVEEEHVVGDCFKILFFDVV